MKQKEGQRSDKAEDLLRVVGFCQGQVRVSEQHPGEPVGNFLGETE